MKYTKSEALQVIRKMGFTARRNEYGIQLKYADCLHKRDHGTEVETWNEAVSQCETTYYDGNHCCDELAGRTPSK